MGTINMKNVVITDMKMVNLNDIFYPSKLP